MESLSDIKFNSLYILIQTVPNHKLFKVDDFKFQTKLNYIKSLKYCDSKGKLSLKFNDGLDFRKYIQMVKKIELIEISCIGNTHLLQLGDLFSNSEYKDFRIISLHKCKIEFNPFSSQKIKKIIISECYLNSNDIISLSQCYFENLKVLKLLDNLLTDDIMESSNFSNFLNLKELDFNKNYLKKLSYLENTRFKKLVKLKLGGNEIGDNIHILSKFEFISNLKTLDLSCNKLGYFDKCLNHLSLSDLRNLSKLILRGNKLSSNHIKDFVNFNCGNLEKLDLSFNEIDFLFFSYFSKNLLKNFKNLNLKGNKITSNGLKFLGKCNFLSLEKLNISKNSISAGLINFKNGFPNLKTLDLSKNEFSFEELKLLAQLNLPSLLLLNLSNNK